MATSFDVYCSVAWSFAFLEFLFVLSQEKKKNDLIKQFILKFPNGLKTFAGSPKGSLSPRIFRHIIQIDERLENIE